MNSDPRAAASAEGTVGWRPALPILALWAGLCAFVVPLAASVWPEDGLVAAGLAAGSGLVCAVIGYAFVAATANRSPHLFLAGVAGGMLARLVAVCASVFFVLRYREQLGVVEGMHFAVCLLTFVLTLLFAEAAILARAIARPSH